MTGVPASDWPEAADPGGAAAAVIAAGLAHAGAMAAIHAAAFPPAERWNLASIAATLAMPGVVGLVAPAGGMALLRLAADEAELLTLAVRPSRRRAGVGRQLLGTALAQAGRAGATQLLLEVKATNSAALALYQQAGFRVVGSRCQYYADGADALVLRVALGGSAETDPKAAGFVTPCG